MENLNQRGKHVELWANNAFDERWVFEGFDLQISIVDMFENE
jgi:hypothetical protein